MADTKLSFLTELAVEPADTDEIYVNDGGTSKRITYATLKSALLNRANHTGTDSTSIISGLTEVTVAAGDYIMVLDVSTSPISLKKILASDFATAAQANATHTGDVTGATALSLQPVAISGQTSATASGSDYVLILDTSDSPNTLKKALVSDLGSAFGVSDITGAGAITVAGTDLLVAVDVSASPQVLGQATAQAVANLKVTELSEDTTPVLSGNLAAGGFNVTDLGDVTFKTGATGGTLRTGTSNADKFQLQAYDVDGAAYVTLIEADAGNDVRLQIPADYLDLEDATDNTKIARFDVSGVATSTTRTITMPDANVDLGAIATNTAKVTNATHTGDATGATALTLQPAAITGKGAVTVDGADLLLVTDVSASPQVLGQVTAQSIANLAPAVQGSAILSSDTSPLVTDGYVLTADGAGGAAWEAGGGSVDWSTTQTSNLSAATGDEVAFDLSSTVNKATSGNYTGIKLNVTETAAPGSNDRLLDFAVGGTSLFSVDNLGHLNLVQDVNSSTRLNLLVNGTSIASCSSTNAFRLRSDGFFAWSTNTSPATGTGTAIYSDAQNVVAQRNSTNAQTFRVYGTYTDASNYERLAISGSAITVETAGTGTDDIDLTLTPAGAGVVKFGTHSAIGAESVTGYITIKDAGGTTRKIAVVS